MSKVRLALLLLVGALLVSGCATHDPADQELPWSGRSQQDWMYAPPGMGGMGGMGY